MKTHRHLLAFPLSLGLAITSGLSVNAKTPPQAELIGSKPFTGWLIAQSFKVPKRGAPSTTAGGATRGSCSAKGKQLTALMPKEKLGLTLSDRPTLFWYIPQSRTHTARFLLLANNDTKVVYETTVTLPKTPGIAQFTLPTNAPALEIGKQYHWTLSMNCNADGFGDEMMVDGWVERIQPTVTLSQALQNADLQKQVALYAEAGIWHEALMGLAKLRVTNPRNSRITLRWKELLQSVGLNSVVSEPLVDGSKLSKN